MVNHADRNKSLSTSQLYVNNKKSWQIKCSKWLNDCELVRSNSEYVSSVSSNSVNYSISEDLEFDFKTTNCDDSVFKSWSSLSKLDESKHLDHRCNQTIFDNINIHKSKRIHIGNITYITGPVILNDSEIIHSKFKKLNKLILNERLSTRYIEQYGNDIYNIPNMKNKSIFKRFSNIIFCFMELCMKLVDGA